MEKAELEKGMEGKTFDQMNRHELALAAGNAVDRVNAAQEKLKSAFDNMPATAKMAAGDQLAVLQEQLNANAELLLATRAELALFLKIGTYL